MYILIHIGTNDLVIPTNGVKDILVNLQKHMKQLMLEILENGPFIPGANHWGGGVIWPDILPCTHWKGFNFQKAVEKRHHRFNTAVGMHMSCTGVWRLTHKSFHLKFRMDYCTCDTTHLSDGDNHKFYSEIEEFVQTLTRAKNQTKCD